MDRIHEIPCAILACCVLHNLCLKGTNSWQWRRPWRIY